MTFCLAGISSAWRENLVLKQIAWIWIAYGIKDMMAKDNYLNMRIETNSEQKDTTQN